MKLASTFALNVMVPFEGSSAFSVFTLGLDEYGVAQTPLEIWLSEKLLRSEV